MDPVTIERLASEYPERYRGGRIDRTRPISQVTTAEAWDRARLCLDNDNPARAAYWTGYATGSDAQAEAHGA